MCERKQQMMMLRIIEAERRSTATLRSRIPLIKTGMIVVLIEASQFVSQYLYKQQRPLGEVRLIHSIVVLIF